MNPRWLEFGLGGVTVVGLGVATRLALWPLAAPRFSDPIAPATAPQEAAGAPAESLAAAIAGRDPFRVTRRPAALRYHVPPPPAPPAPPVPHVPKPSLSLTGIVWSSGTQGSALIEGFPGISGARPVRPGDVFGGIRVQQIADDSVVLAGLDTVWVLRVRRATP